MLQKDDLKAIIDGVSSLIDARAKTTETLIKGEITSVKEEFNKRLDETTEELRTEILAGRAEAKADHLDLRAKIEKVTKSHERRLEALEEKTGSPNPHKN